MMPRLNSMKAKLPAMGRNASAACDEVWMSVRPWMFNVTAVVSTMKNATRLENPMPIKVSLDPVEVGQRLLWRGIFGGLRLRVGAQFLDFLGPGNVAQAGLTVGLV